MSQNPLKSKNHFINIHSGAEELDGINSSNVAASFLDDYKRVIGFALSGKPALTCDEEKDWNFPIKITSNPQSKACTIDLPELTVHLFQDIFDSRRRCSDVTILEAKNTKSYIVICGVEGKNEVSRRTVCAALLPSNKDPVEGVGDIIALWDKYFKDLKSLPSLWESQMSLAKNMRPICIEDFEPIAERYIKTIFRTAPDAGTGERSRLKDQTEKPDLSGIRYG